MFQKMMSLLYSDDNSGSICFELEGNDANQLEEKILNQLQKKPNKKDL